MFFRKCNIIEVFLHGRLLHRVLITLAHICHKKTLNYIKDSRSLCSYVNLCIACMLPHIWTPLWLMEKIKLR